MKFGIIAFLLLPLVAAAAEAAAATIVTDEQQQSENTAGERRTLRSGYTETHVEYYPKVTKGSKGGGGGGGGGSKSTKSGGGKYQNHYGGVCPVVIATRRGQYDLGYRFNKFTMDISYEGPDIYMDWDDYPMLADKELTLQHESDAASVVSKDDYEVHGICIEEYIQKIGGWPTYPEGNPHSPFWRDLGEVVQRQIDRRNGMLPPPDVLYLPDMWSDWNVYQVAESVHDEYPGTLQSLLLQQFIKDGIELDYTILTFRCKNEFIGKNHRFAALNTWSIGLIAPINFHTKWHCGRPRPEEVAWWISTDVITAEDGADPDLVDWIKSMRLQGPTDFTQYPEGCPRHPSWPAMHSAASPMSFWLAVVADLTPYQLCQALRTDYLVAYARTVAGVHYPTDNYAGLNLGQELIAEYLPDHLAHVYGSDPEKVRQKIHSLRFDWRTFNPETCTVKYTNGYDNTHQGNW